MLKNKKMSNFWFNLSDKIRFLIIGAFNAGISYLIFLVVCLILGENYYQLSLALAWIISSITSFTTQRLFVFNIEGCLIKQYCKCCATWLFSYIINAALLEIFIKMIKINVYISQIFATFICALFTYILFKVFAFRRTK